MKKYTIAVSTLDFGISKYQLPIIDFKDEFEYIFVHQISPENKDINFDEHYARLKENVEHIEFIVCYELGLSKSRNVAIDACNSEYIIFSDDDNTYVKNMKEILDYEIHRLKQPDCLSFIITNENGVYFKKYSKSETPHTLRTILRLSSIENVFRMKLIKDNNIRFDEDFGLGSKYPSCEQCIFGSELIKLDANCFYIPREFAIHPLENSGNLFFEPLNALTRRKMLVKIFGKFGYILSLMFYIIKIKDVPLRKQKDFLYGLFIK